MKKMNWLIALLSVFSLTFVACGNDEGTETPQPEPQTPVEQSFDIQIDVVTYNSVEFIVTPTVLDAEYLCMLYDAETVESFRKDEYIIQTLYQDLESEARGKGMTLEEYLPSFTDKGVLSAKSTQLAPESDYYILVVGVDPARGYNTNTALFKQKFTTEPVPAIEVTFDIQTTVDGNTATYVVTPSDPEAIWYFYTAPTDAIDYYLSPNGYGLTSLSEFLMLCVQSNLNAYVNAGYSEQEAYNAIFHKGTLTLSAKDLTPNTNYTNIIAGFVMDENQTLTLATDVTTSTYTTGEAKAIDLTFNISVTDIEATKAAIKVTPSDITQKFYWQIGAWDGKEATEIMNEMVAMYASMWGAGWGLYSGVQDYTGGPGSPYKMTLDAPDTEYFIIAFGYTPGVGLTTEPTMVTFRTLPAAPAEDAVFSIAVDSASISPYSFALNLTSSDSSTYYVLGTTVDGTFDEAAEIAAFETAIDEDFAAWYEYYGDSLTMSQYLGSNYYRGSNKMTVSGLEPGTTYMVYLYALDINTGHVAKCHTFNNVATTLALGDVVPTFEYVKHFSGIEENGEIFGQPAATADKAITVVKYANLENARSLFTSMSEGDATDIITYPDSDLWSLVYEWDTVNVKQPYSFYITTWDEDYTLLAYAVSKDSGNPGALARILTRATVENKSNIEELKDLVAELNSESATRYAMPRSLVVKEEPRVVADVVEVESVGIAMPAAPQGEGIAFPMVYIK